MRRIARIAAFLLVGAAASYLVGMNVFLRTHLFRDAIGFDAEMLLVDYKSAYSLWPGEIHADALTIRGRDSHVEWILRIEKIDFHVSFLDLARKKFHAASVRGDGISMRIRLRQDAFSAETASSLPPIPGFTDPPFKDVGPPAPPLTDANYNLWSIQLDGVAASHVNELWIDSLRYAGDLDIHGRWFFRPMRWLDVGPAVLDVRALDVSFGLVEPWITGVAGRLEATVHPFSLVTVDGADLLDQVSVRGEVRGIGLVSSPANRALDGKGVEVMGGEAPFELRAELDHGVLRAGTHFRTEPFAAHAKASGLVFDGSVQVDAHVDDGGVAFADLRVEDVRAAARGKTQATVASFAVTLTTRDLDLAKEPFSNSLYAVEVNRAESDAMAFWSSYVPFPAGVDVDSAHAVLGARIHGVTRDMKAEGYVTVALERLAIAGRGGSVVGDLEGVVQLDGSLPAERVDLTRSRLSLRHLIARMQGSHLEIPRLDARAEDLVVGRGGATGRVAIEAPQVLLPVLTTVGSFLPLPEDVSIEGGGCTARVRLDVDVARLVATGEVAILARNLHVRVADRHLAGDLTMTLRAKEHGTETDVSGTEVAFRSAADPKTVDWWVRARMRQATLQVRPGFRFRSGVVASARDGSPLTALVADNTAIPHWLIDVVSTRSLEVTGDVLVTPSVFALRSVEAHAAGAYVGFELGKIRRDRKEWAMLLDLGAALAGVDVTDGHTQVLLLGARPWFQAKVALLQAAERRSE